LKVSGRGMPNLVSTKRDKVEANERCADQSTEQSNSKNLQHVNRSIAMDLLERLPECRSF